MESLLENVFFIILWISSSISVIYHLYKFYNSPTPKSPPAWTISFYCCFLLLIYILTPLYSMDIFFTMQRAMVMAEYIKFIIVLDILLTFYNTVVYYEEPFSYTTNKKLVYYLFSTSIPLLYSLVFFLPIGARDPHVWFGPFVIVEIIRVVACGVIIGALWFMRLASKSIDELWGKYDLHLRILVIIGGLSIVTGIADIWFVMHRDDPEFERYEINGYADPYCWEYFLDGLVIGLFALERNTFRVSATATQSNYQSTQCIANAI